MRDSRRIFDSDSDEADDNNESIVGTDLKTVSKESSPAPLADAIDNEHLNDTETPVIVATVRFDLSLF